MKQQQQQTTKALIEDAKSFLDTSVVYIGHIRPCDIILQLQTNYYPSPNTQAYIHSLRHSHSVYAIGLLNIKVLMAGFQDLWLSVGWWELMLGLNQWGFLDCLAGPASLISTCETELHWGQRESHHLTPIRTLTAIKKIVSTLWLTLPWTSPNGSRLGSTSLSANTLQQLFAKRKMVPALCQQCKKRSKSAAETEGHLRSITGLNNYEFELVSIHYT